ncbi:MAG: site-2 protease family protein [Pseudomonadota bacterium]
MILQTALLALVAGLTWAVLRGGWRLNMARLDMRPKGEALVLGILALGAAIWFFGLAGGIALTLAVAVHEFGHVAAFRVAGHPDATFRLIPFLGGVASSRKSPASDLHDWYITIMGPGICLVLMCAAWLLLLTPLGSMPFLGSVLYFLAVFNGALNFFNLLPIYPLDGGRIFWTVFGAYAPQIAKFILLGMTGLIALAAVASFSIFLFILALFSFQALGQIGHGRRRMRAMTHGQAAMAAAAWLLMLAAFGLGSFGFILQYIGPLG